MINNYNLAVRKRGTRTLVHLSSDGSEANYYELSSIAWSPDSRKIAAYRVRPGYRREVHYVESSPEDQLQPKYSSLLYAKPGDVLDVDQPVVFNVDPRQQMIVDNALFPNAYANSELVWRNDSRAVTFEYNQRGHQVYRIIEIDAATGRARAVISEEPKTFFTYRTATGALSDSGKKYRFDVNDGKEVIWMSERDGWNHLYLYDGVTGAVKNQITKGSWVVRAVQHVDPAARRIWFSAGGMYPGKDPYFRVVLPHQLRRLRPRAPDGGRRESRGDVLVRHGVLRRYVLAHRSGAGRRAPPHIRQRAGVARWRRGTSPSSSRQDGRRRRCSSRPGAMARRTSGA